MDKKRLLTYAEGRESIEYIPESMKDGATSCGWDFSRMYAFDMADMEDNDKLEEAFPTEGGIILRNLPQNDDAEIAALTTWLNKNDHVSVNFNAVGGLTASNDKQFQQVLFLNDPRTKDYILKAFVVRDADEVLALIDKGVMNYPILLKPRDGSIGQGIKAIHDEEELRANTKWEFMSAQQFIESTYDWRVYVVGGAPIGTVRRSGKEGKEFDFEAQASGIETDLEKDQITLNKLSKMASYAAAVTGLEFAGVDIISDRKTGKYWILESNTSPTWAGYYNELFGTSVAGEVVKWMNERIEGKKQPKHVAMKEYVERRLNKLSDDARMRYTSIISLSEYCEPEDADNLTLRLHKCYNEFIFGDGENLEECRCLIEEVEGRPYCWAGNFIGSATWGEDGALEDGCIPTAYYLAIREKYDKIVEAN